MRVIVACFPVSDLDIITGQRMSGRITGSRSILADMPILILTPRSRAELSAARMFQDLCSDDSETGKASKEKYRQMREWAQDVFGEDILDYPPVEYL